MIHFLIPFRIFRVTVFTAKRGISTSEPYFRNDETGSWKGYIICLGSPFGGGAKNGFLDLLARCTTCSVSLGEVYYVIFILMKKSFGRHHHFTDEITRCIDCPKSYKNGGSK